MHILKLKRWKEEEGKKWATIYSITDKMSSKGKGTTSGCKEVNTIRPQALHEVCKANIPVNTLRSMALWIETPSLKTLGGVSNLTDMYSEVLLHDLQEKSINILD